KFSCTKIRGLPATLPFIKSSYRLKSDGEVSANFRVRRYKEAMHNLTDDIGSAWPTGEIAGCSILIDDELS
ncbi:hypothetical protein, partial [Enterobacter cloacae complex sp. P11RS]|uniref:hypothetical protein n=1 Tax=Enterobacter cloacae complex sp. P11RS TaxID=2779583 RepID=UPI001D0BF172